MILTRSRLHAVRYRQVLDRYLNKRGYPYKALVAFSGTVEDPDTGKKYTERNMNGGIPETQTDSHFHKDEYRFLVVANKFQTGFNEPLLTAMYVDKRLGGVRAVQSLSRLNRKISDKRTTFVLDFANEAESIQAAFADYYETTLLSEGTDPNLLYDLQHKLAAHGFFTSAEVDQLARNWYAARQAGDVDPRHPKIHNALQPAVDRYQAAEEEEQIAFRDLLKKYVRTYAFLGQLLPFVDRDLEELYLFARLLLKRLPYQGGSLPTEVVDQVDLASYDVRVTHNGGIDLETDGELKPQKGGGKSKPHQEELAALSEIVQLLNEQFGMDISEEEGEDFLDKLLQRLLRDEALAKSVEVNAPEDARLTFREVINDIMQDMLEVNFKMYKMYTEEQHFAETIRDWMFAKYSQEQSDQITGAR
jgi:type I restriction enzyme R subunit